MSNSHPLEVVGRGSETHISVSKNLNLITYRFMVKGRVLRFKNIVLAIVLA